MPFLCNRCVFHSGDIINKQYTVINMLGAGSFGCVYRVKDKSGQDYALKLLKLWEIVGDDRQQLLQNLHLQHLHLLVLELKYMLIHHLIQVMLQL